jgi:hypothetical protein
MKTSPRTMRRALKTLLKALANSYESLTNSYPNSAINNPSAPTEYVKSAIDLGNKYLSGIFSRTNSFLGKVK